MACFSNPNFILWAVAGYNQDHSCGLGQSRDEVFHVLGNTWGVDESDIVILGLKHSGGDVDSDTDLS